MNAGPIFARTRSFWLILPIAVVALALRVEDISFVEDSLFADDGYVFIKHANELGIRSVWAAYAGYHHLYIRIVALFARSLPLAITPYIFLFGAIVPFLSIVYVLTTRAERSGIDHHLIALLVIAIALQPIATACSFLYLTPSFFLLGTALAFYVCLPSHKPTSLLEGLFLVVASLSGPFSSVLIPVLAVRFAALRDWASRKAMYTIVPICGMIQAISIVVSPRISKSALDASTEHWLHALGSSILFGATNRITCATAVLFWCVTLLSFVRWILVRRRLDPAIWISPTLAAVAAIVMLFVIAMASGYAAISDLNPMNDIFARYFIFPYSLIFYIAFVCAKDDMVLKLTTTCLTSAICAANFLTIPQVNAPSTADVFSRAHLQWTAYAKFQKLKPDLVIPINPQWPLYPPLWTAQRIEDDEGELGSGDGAYIRLTSKETKYGEAGLEYLRESAPSAKLALGPIYFDIRDYCVTSNYIALEIKIWRRDMGWAKISWGTPGSFESRKSLERFYLEGYSLMQFAFRRARSDYLIRLDPAGGVPNSGALRFLNQPDIKSFFSRFGTIAPNQIDPGGEAKIEEARLFCLD
ncbi:hypothetical protein JM946_29500 [Steroidobacter sp. S1-65]|uniref:Uncharacterized protein n=2 Tax=Steroidobacter gossypii TaxID=2805490 RepID=A0ABS1X6N4_9GAMM|nr:hypothetical protein [Steroidobacter gossypii]